jgi:hypothetical protein
MNSPNTEKHLANLVAVVQKGQDPRQTGRVRALGRGLLPRTSYRPPQGERPKAKGVSWSE